MRLPAFWVSKDQEVFIQLEATTPFDLRIGCYRTHLLPDLRFTGVGHQFHRLWTSQRGLDQEACETLGCEIPLKYLLSPPEAPNFPILEVERLREQAQKTLCSALRAIYFGWAPAFIGAPGDGRTLANLIPAFLGLKSASYTVTEQTSLRDLVGDPRKPRTLLETAFSRCLLEGGIFIFNVPELTPRIAKILANFSAFTEDAEGGLTVDLSLSFGYPEGSRQHQDFHLIFNLPESDIPLPSELASNLHPIWVEEGCTEDVAQEGGYEEVDSGPGTVLVLMKFNVDEYESWFQQVIDPTVQQVIAPAETGYRVCVRITKGLDEWRTEMRRVLERADAVVVDLSHDLTSDLSINVIWELVQLYRAGKDKTQALTRERILCCSRGLQDIKSRDEDADFVYMRDVNPRWLPASPARGSLNLESESVLGLRIRRYDSHNQQSVRAFQVWLASSLAPLVQGIRPPLIDKQLRQNALEYGRSACLAWSELARRFAGDEAINQLPQSKLDRLDAEEIRGLWTLSIAERNIDACFRLFKRQKHCPEGMEELLGCLLATVSATKVVSYPGYWTMAKSVLARSPTLRTHLLKVMGTQQIHTQHYLTNHFRDNAWFCFSKGSWSKQEFVELKRLANMEADADIQLTALSVLHRLGVIPRRVLDPIIWGYATPENQEAILAIDVSDKDEDDTY